MIMTPLKKLRLEDAKTTDELISQIENKDRRFRLAQTVFMVSTFIALAIVIGFQNSALNGLTEQQEQAKQREVRQEKSAVDARDKIIRRLDCMTVFFSQTDRTNLSIADIDRCTLNRDGDIQQFFIEDAQGNPTTTKTEQPSPPKVISTPPIQGGGATPSQPTMPGGPILPPVVPNQPNILDILNPVRRILCPIGNIVIVCQ